VKSPAIRWFLWSLAAVFALGCLAVFGLMLFVFSIGTASVRLDVTTTVLDKATTAPIAGCLLAFERSQNSGWGRTTERTDARGVSRHEVSFSYVGSLLMFWDRDRHPTLTMYVGDPPRYETLDEVEMWVIHMDFDEPMSGDRVTPTVRLERRMAFENARRPDGGFQQAGSRPAPDALTDALGPVEIRFSRSVDGYQVYEIPLTILLDSAQAQTCTAPSTE